MPHDRPHSGNDGRPLRGMSPEKLLGVFEHRIGDPPVVPGWTILGVAGRGGFGVVWRARREADGALAAIKIAPGDEPDTLERIETEAVALSSLNHPHIVSLLDSGPVGEDGSGLYLAMEFIDGPDLCQEIPRDGLRPALALKWFRQVALAVIHAHNHQVLHRDLKPSNILIDGGGNAHVADFGLALPVHRRVHQLSLTRAGMIAGTAEYLPPEAYLAGYEPTPSADVFALGVILHEMLTGSPPRGAWAPASSKSGVDVRIDGIIARAMAPDPAHRWPDVRSMLAELEAVNSSPLRLAGTPLVTFPVRVMDAVWTLAGLGMAAAAMGSVFNLWKFRIQLPFDLVGDLGRILGAFHALFLLSFPACFVGFWQLVRVIRFRHTPVREALPSPFGLPLSRGRTSAVLVAMAQVFCLMFPSLMMTGLFLDSCLVWLEPQDPPWTHGLAVTRWGDGATVSPWTQPGGAGFWLVERFGPPGHPLGRDLDRVGFVPFLVPLVMTLGGVALGAGLLAMLFVAFRSWSIRRKPVGLMLLALWTALSLHSLADLARREIRDAESHRIPTDALSEHRAGIILHQVHQFADDLIAYESGSRSEPPATSVRLASMVDFRGQGWISAASIPEIRFRKRHPCPPAGALNRMQASSHWEASSKRFLVRHGCQTFHDDPEAGESRMIEWWTEIGGRLCADGMLEIDRESLEFRECYRGAIRNADEDDAARWLADLRGALESGDPLRLAGAFPPSTTPAAGTSTAFPGWIAATPDPSSPWLHHLREEMDASGWQTPLKAGRLPGGRTRFTLPLRGDSRYGTRTLFADLVSIEGSWRCVRLDDDP